VFVQDHGSCVRKISATNNVELTLNEATLLKERVGKIYNSSTSA
jgi:hypothetical protein